MKVVSDVIERVEHFKELIANGEKGTTTWHEIGVAYDGLCIGKSSTRALEKVDRSREPAASREDPSKWIIIGLDIVDAILPLLAMSLKPRGPWGELLAAVGRFCSTKKWDYIEEYMRSG